MQRDFLKVLYWFCVNLVNVPNNTSMLLKTSVFITDVLLLVNIWKRSPLTNIFSHAKQYPEIFVKLPCFHHCLAHHTSHLHKERCKHLLYGKWSQGQMFLSLHSCHWLGYIIWTDVHNLKVSCPTVKCLQLLSIKVHKCYLHLHLC